MNRFFNTAGPCHPERHYMLGPLKRLPGVEAAIAGEAVWTLHRSRRDGKSTLARALAAKRREAGEVAWVASLESVRGAPDVASARGRMWDGIVRAAELYLDRALVPVDRTKAAAPDLATGLLTWAAAVAPRRLFLVLDDADGLAGEALVDVWRSLANLASTDAPVSVGLVSLTDLDRWPVRAESAPHPPPLPGPRLQLPTWTAADVAQLCAQHTGATGQTFSAAAIDRLVAWSGGHAYYPNAIAYELTSARPISREAVIEAAHVDAAAWHLIERGVSHLNTLEHRAFYPGVVDAVRGIFSGDAVPSDEQTAAAVQEYLDLGVFAGELDALRFRNPIIAEIVARRLSRSSRDALPAPRVAALPDGRLDFPALIDVFLRDWRECGDRLLAAADPAWRACTPQLTFSGFVQRALGSGGALEHVVAAGRGGVGFVVRAGGDVHAVEIGQDRASAEVRLVRALDTLGLDQGWLLVFDQRPGLSWEERLWAMEVERGGKRIFARGG